MALRKTVATDSLKSFMWLQVSWQCVGGGDKDGGCAVLAPSMGIALPSLPQRLPCTAFLVVSLFPFLLPEFVFAVGA